MSHHNFDGVDPEMDARFKDMLAKQQADLHEMREAHLRQDIGPTNTHPEGKLTDKDDGGLQFAIAQTGGKIIINFGSPVSWVGMNPEDAESLAQSLLSKAREARKIIGRDKRTRSLKANLLRTTA